MKYIVFSSHAYKWCYNTFVNMKYVQYLVTSRLTHENRKKYMIILWTFMEKKIQSRTKI